MPLRKWNALLLFRAKDSVAGVAEAGDDVGVFVELFIDCCDEDVDIRVLLLDQGDALRAEIRMFFMIILV